MEVIAAPATPPGESALGVVRLSGDGCLAAAGAFLRWESPPEPRRSCLVRAFGPDAEPLDRALAVWFPGPASYTGEDMLEISTHGSPFVLRRLLESAVAAGARLARPGEFTLRAYLHGRLDLAQAEAVGALIRARTDWAHRTALGQLDGRLSGEVRGQRERTLGALARVEAALDHPDEDLPALDGAVIAAELDSLGDDARALAGTHRAGRFAVDGARVVLVGRPNAGKSTLLNAWLGRDRAIVDALPGTTRDTLEEPADLDGLPAVLVDTAGLREAPDSPVEREGIARSRRALEGADLAVLVVDRTRPLGSEELGLLARRGRLPVVVALNKSDLAGGVVGPDDLAGASAVEVCARSGDGLVRLATAVRGGLGAGAAGALAEGGTLVTLLRHRLALEEAAGELARAADAARLERLELSAAHLRGALAALGSILGLEGDSSDEVLARIFADFCIGK